MQRTWNVDNARLCVIGESGGGYIVTGIGMKLSINNESSLCKLLVPIIPMISNIFVLDDSKLFPIEKQGKKDMNGF